MLAELFFLYLLHSRGRAAEVLNVALGKEANQSAVESPAELAVDGSNKTCSETKVGEAPWLAVDLGRVYNIHSVQIVFSSACENQPSYIGVYVHETFQLPYNVDMVQYRCRTVVLDTVTDVRCGLQGRVVLISRGRLEASNSALKRLCICELEVLGETHTSGSPVPELYSQGSPSDDVAITTSFELFPTLGESSPYPSVSLEETALQIFADMTGLVNLLSSNAEILNLVFTDNEIFIQPTSVGATPLAWTPEDMSTMDHSARGYRKRLIDSGYMGAPFSYSGQPDGTVTPATVMSAVTELPVLSVEKSIRDDAFTRTIRRDNSTAKQTIMSTNDYAPEMAISEIIRHTQFHPFEKTELFVPVVTQKLSHSLSAASSNVDDGTQVLYLKSSVVSRYITRSGLETTTGSESATLLSQYSLWSSPVGAAQLESTAVGTMAGHDAVVTQSSACLCPCGETLHSRSASPEFMSTLLTSLNISVRNVSRSRRRYCSVSDNRISSQVTGYSAIVLLVAIFGGLILIDLLSAVRFIHNNHG